MRITKNIRWCTFIVTGLFLMVTYSCKKEKQDPPAAQETGSVSDISGNTYKTVKIGNQWWMAENLRVTRYNDSSQIKNITISTIPNSNTQWANDTTGGAYCDRQDGCGLLYNFYAVSNSKKIAPAGWHIPSDDEWKTLEKYLGMSQGYADETGWRGTREGEKLKSTGVSAWDLYNNVKATNESGFAALAGGCCMFNDDGWGDNLAHGNGFWWSSTSHGNEVWYRYLDYKNANVFRYYGPKTYGFSVRCVKD